MFIFGFFRKVCCLNLRSWYKLRHNENFSGQRLGTTKGDVISAGGW